MKKVLLLSIIATISLNAEVFVYGPGGPAPVMKQLAKEFELKTGEKINITAGPTPKWISSAKNNADIIYAGNSSMMDSFIKMMPNKLNAKDIEVLNARAGGLVVRPNNPKNINSFDDILKPDINIMVVDGAGQVGLYEDMALKDGNKDNLSKLRKNIKIYTKNSKEAIDTWNNNKDIDVLIIWPHWAKVLGDQKAKFIQAGEKNVIYRSAEIAPTTKGLKNKTALEFIKFIQSKEAQKAWKDQDWIVNN